MPQLIEIPGYGQVEFPDNMDDAQIAQAIQRNIMPPVEEHPLSGVTPEVRLKTMNPDYKPLPEWTGKYPNLYATGQLTREMLGPSVEALGLVGGGMAGSPIPIAGNLAGAGMGYAAAKRLNTTADVLLGNRPPETLLEAAGQTAKDIGTGVTAEMGGQVLGQAGSKVMEGGKGLARKLYESALKPVPSLKTAVREKAISTGIENAVKGEATYRPTEKHLYNLSSKISRLVEQSDDLVKTASKEGDTVSTKKIADSIDDLIKEYSKGPLPTKDIEVLQSYKNDFLSTHGEKISTEKALEMKKFIYSTAEKYYETAQKVGYGGIDPLKVGIEKAIARAIRKELETLYPQTIVLNKEASKQLNFAKVLERASNRVGNRELFSFFDFMGSAAGGMVGGGPGMATGGLMSKMLTGAQIKSLIAKEITKAAIPGTVKKQMLNQVLKYGLAKTQEMNDE